MNKTIRLFAVFLAVFMICSMCGAALALEGYETYTFDEVSLSVPVPEDTLVVLTRDMEEDDFALSLMEMTAEEVAEMMEAGGNYLDVIDGDMRWEFIVTVMDSKLMGILLDAGDMTDYLNTLSDSEEEAFFGGVKEGLLTSLEAGGAVVEFQSSGVYRGDYYSFVELRWYMELDGVAGDVVSYITIKDGLFYQFAFKIIDGEISVADDEVFLTIVDNIRLGEDIVTESHTEQPVSETAAEPGDGGGYPAAVAGYYVAVECTMDGEDAGLDDEYLVLEEDGTGLFSLDGTEFALEWDLDGEDFSFIDESGDAFKGYYDDGEIGGDYFSGLYYVFVKEKEESFAVMNDEPAKSGHSKTELAENTHSKEEPTESLHSKAESAAEEVYIEDALEEIDFDKAVKIGIVVLVVVLLMFVGIVVLVVVLIVRSNKKKQAEKKPVPNEDYAGPAVFAEDYSQPRNPYSRPGMGDSGTYEPDDREDYLNM